MQLKVCGITRPGQLHELDLMGISFAGLIFHPASPRYVVDKMDGDSACAEPFNLKKTGVFVNMPLEELGRYQLDYEISLLQLHGDENPAYCEAARKLAPVIKVFRLGAEENLDALLEPFQESCDFFLFDTQTRAYGGSGQQFDWNIVMKAKINKPFFLSGGIGPEDAGRLRTIHHPYLFALDLNSRFETAPGLKNMDKVQEFLNVINRIEP